MLNPMSLTVDDIAKIISECEEKGVAISIHAQPIVKKDTKQPNGSEPSKKG